MSKVIVVFTIDCKVVYTIHLLLIDIAWSLAIMLDFHHHIHSSSTFSVRLPLI